MLKFFRRIRKKLLSDNKLSKYLIYAIGEIVLVVIGILIALQINNWNENTKLKELEKDLLKEVHNSLLKDLIDVNTNIRAQQKTIDSQEIVIDWIESDEDFNDTLSSHISRVYLNTYFAAYEGPYETLKQIGMRNIRNDSLRNQISKLYNITYPYYYLVDEFYARMIEEQFIPHSFEHFSEVDWIRPIKVTNISKLRADHEFISLFKTTRNTAQVLTYVIMLPTKEEIELTLRMIEEELKE
ncbi:DUF6090 family protein [Balneola vulgaris]|uniref:DUF6090 family protein n=1 Tax=Balneola vulgaris TaxID=287535 RepID=UPI00036E0972|nr:DUF6090 family protein [Balneola vulgaris]